jgi:hypothetical protein
VPLAVLYVGLVAAGLDSTAYHRMLAMRGLGHEVLALDSSWPPQAGAPSRLLHRLERKLIGRMRDGGLQSRILEALAARKPELLWIDKGLTVAPRTLRRARELAPGLRIVGYTPDDMSNPGNQSRQYHASLPLYDLYFTTKSYQVAELTALGCRRVVFVENAYAPELHRPVALADAERHGLGGPVGFIGTPELERARSLAYLGEHGVPVKVWGNHWEPWLRRFGGRFTLAGPAVYGERYARVLCAFDINLCFLRKINRDLQTTRTMEIPACGRFMLAERTDEHLALFEEGKEAEFFASDEELLSKVRFYMGHPAERERVAAAGRERCLRSGYSNHARMAHMLAIAGHV